MRTVFLLLALFLAQAGHAEPLWVTTWSSETGATSFGHTFGPTKASKYLGTAILATTAAGVTAMGVLAPTVAGPGGPKFWANPDTALAIGLAGATLGMGIPKWVAARIGPDAGSFDLRYLSIPLRYPETFDRPFTEAQLRSILEEELLVLAQGKAPVLVVRRPDGKRTYFITHEVFKNFFGSLPYTAEGKMWPNGGATFVTVKGDGRKEDKRNLDAYQAKLLTAIENPGEHFAFFEYAGPPPAGVLMPGYARGTSKVVSLPAPQGIRAADAEKTLAAAYETEPFFRGLVGELHARRAQPAVAEVISRALDSTGTAAEVTALRRAAAGTEAVAALIGREVAVPDVISALMSSDPTVQRWAVLAAGGISPLFREGHSAGLTLELLLARVVELHPGARLAFIHSLNRLPWHPMVQHFLPLFLADRDARVANAAYSLLTNADWKAAQTAYESQQHKSLGEAKAKDVRQRAHSAIFDINPELHLLVMKLNEIADPRFVGARDVLEKILPRNEVSSVLRSVGTIPLDVLAGLKSQTRRILLEDLPNEALDKLLLQAKQVDGFYGLRDQLLGLRALAEYRRLGGNDTIPRDFFSFVGSSGIASALMLQYDPSFLPTVDRISLGMGGAIVLAAGNSFGVARNIARSAALTQNVKALMKEHSDLLNLPEFRRMFESASLRTGRGSRVCLWAMRTLFRVAR